MNDTERKDVDDALEQERQDRLELGRELLDIELRIDSWIQKLGPVCGLVTARHAVRQSMQCLFEKAVANE